MIFINNVIEIDKVISFFDDNKVNEIQSLR